MTGPRSLTSVAFAQPGLPSLGPRDVLRIVAELVTLGHLLEFLDLEWNEACLDFHLSGRAITTASAVQVRKPLYRSAIGRWQKYGPGLDPLIAALEPVLSS